MDRTDVEIEEYEEIVGGLRWHESQRETEEARAVSIQEPTLSNSEILMTHPERPTLRSEHESSAGNIEESHPVVVVTENESPMRKFSPGAR